MIINNEFLEADNFSAYTVAGKLEKMKNYIVANAIQGPQGPRGPQGVQGVQGDAGPQGEQGEQGVQGIQGIQGVQGITGQQGERGPQGIQGSQGETGATGPQGIQGATGSQGPQGPKGETGQKGDSGNDFTIQGTVSSTASLPNDLTVDDVGVAYFVGTSIPRPIFSWGYLESGLLGWVNQGTLQGPQGEQGVQGPQGVQGETGPQGIQGETGPQGSQGPQGVKGDKGDKGETGETGPQGIQGVQGQTGPQGPKGDTGEQGPKGDTGEQGPKGDAGADGVDGVSYVTLLDLTGLSIASTYEGSSSLYTRIWNITPLITYENVQTLNNARSVIIELKTNEMYVANHFKILITSKIKDNLFGEVRISFENLRLFSLENATINSSLIQSRLKMQWATTTVVNLTDLKIYYLA